MEIINKSNRPVKQKSGSKRAKKTFYFSTPFNTMLILLIILWITALWNAFLA